jgi:hypothetical protein
MSELNRSSLDYVGQTKEDGLILAVVVSHLDPNYMGALQVEKLREVGNDRERTGQLATVQYCSPFIGSTSEIFNNKTNDYNGTQKSYGFWMVPPDVGTTVVCFFVDGDPSRGYYLGSIQTKDANFMIPGMASTIYHEDGIEERVPVAEYNKKADLLICQDTTRIKKPQHPFTLTLQAQGLLKDDIRGITTSSARREWPSAVFGISTPGPIDKSGPIGKVGKYESKAKMPVSRLGGSTFVMDDGDDKFIRRKNASEGPPDYAAVEDDETDGDYKIPHNELIRIRTRTGHQILLHNSEDLIYIGNARGTTWIELTSDGKMDIYCEDSINVHTKNDFNLYADRDINMEAGRNFNIKVKEEMHTQVGKDNILIIDQNQKIHIKQNKDETVDGNSLYNIIGNYDTNVGGHIFETSGDNNETRSGSAIIETAPVIHMNGPEAATAALATKPQELKTHSVPDQEGSELFKTIVRRVPIKEPWPGHENLSPEDYKPDKTDRDIDGRYEGNSESILITPSFFKKYTTKYDTFSKVKS